MDKSDEATCKTLASELNCLSPMGRNQHSRMDVAGHPPPVTTKQTLNYQRYMESSSITQNYNTIGLMYLGDLKSGKREGPRWVFSSSTYFIASQGTSASTSF
ncbi:hypothetical protein ABEB36_002557 [Hypothenemus hampei]|uniref:Uncharacterized protein n=1 Tax=Hypothenemus hampei TaxID=57062 RepID=A0ABD1F6L2_HYPHA